MTMDTLTECLPDESSAEYVTADDGYEADVEIHGRSSNNNQEKKTNTSNAINEERNHVNAHPALCSLAVNLLIHFSEQ